MRIIQTADMPSTGLGGNTLDLWVYNGLDCCLTHEIHSVLVEQLTPATERIYSLSRAMQGPILEMNIRGIRIDLPYRNQLILDLKQELVRLQAHFDQIAGAMNGETFNWGSWQQLGKFLYETMGLPPVKKRNATGKMMPTTDRDALEQLKVYFYAQPIIGHILAMRDIAKQISTLETSISNGRSHTSFNIAGTNTGRLSSAMADFGTGGNLQNIDRRLRQMYIADPGYKFCNIDLEQADARNVGAICWQLFGMDTFLNAAEDGDLHTTVSRMTWQELPWSTPKDPKADRAVADVLFYREDSYRQTAKKLGHGTNFNGQPPTMAKHTKSPRAIIEDFQRRYFKAFPEVKMRIDWTSNQLRETGMLTTLFGRPRRFFKRRTDPKTLNEACAFEPQSMTADEINNAMVAIDAARREDELLAQVQFLCQVHDSILFQYPEHLEDEIVPLLRKKMAVPLILRGDREFIVPCEVKTGWNWADVGYDKQGNVINPIGLAKFRGHDSRTRAHG